MLFGAPALFFLSGCSQPASDRSPASGAAPPSTAPLPPTATSVPHRVFGQAPVSNRQPSIVVLEPAGERTFPAGEAKPVMDQVGETFLPYILFVRTGEPAEFRNSDEVLHNMNVREDETKTQAFNVAIPTGEAYKYTFGKDGFYSVRCDIHPAMSALIVSTSSPYAVQTDATGSFTFDEVEAGSYLLRVYAGLQKLEKRIDVAGASTEVSVSATPTVEESSREPLESAK